MTVGWIQRNLSADRIAVDIDVIEERGGLDVFSQQQASVKTHTLHNNFKDIEFGFFPIFSWNRGSESEK